MKKYNEPFIEPAPALSIHSHPFSLSRDQFLGDLIESSRIHNKPGKKMSVNKLVGHILQDAVGPSTSAMRII